MPAEDRAGRAVGVDRLQPGDHAFLAFSDDEDRWDVLTVFTQQGFARGEKVALLIDVGYSPDAVAARVAGGAAAARGALRERRLVVSGTPRFERGKFDAGRLVEGVRRRIGTALAEGFSGLRSASEMSLAARPRRPPRPGRRVRDRAARGAVLRPAPRGAKRALHRAVPVGRAAVRPDRGDGRGA